jgi:type IV/VI secretion system ImpK/VasF family protein
MTPLAGLNRSGNLALSCQEVLTAAVRLRWKRQEPRDIGIFRHHCREAIKSAFHDARTAGYATDDIRLATYGVVAYLDETVLQMGDARFASWMRQPIEEELFGSREAPGGFYRILDELVERPVSRQNADLIEVYYLCLLLGFGASSPERRKVMQRAAARIRDARGPMAELCPSWRVPDTPGSPPVSRQAVVPATAAVAAEGPIDELLQRAEVRLSVLGVGQPVSELPVVLVAGETGTVKTSSIEHSGVARELLAGEVYRDGNISFTPLGNLWWAKERILAEAGGSLLADVPAWRRFIHLLQPKGAAARAALVCYGADRFTKPKATEQAAASGRALHERLEEFAHVTRGPVPVYVLFTKMDRLFGFLEFVRHLTHEESSQAVGSTLPAPLRSDTADTLSLRLAEHFDRLYHSLADARTELLARESDPAKIEPAYEFPREFHKIESGVKRFLAALCPAGEPGGPFLRGFYFSGARPIVIEEGALPEPSATQASTRATGMFQSRLASIPPVAPALRRKIPQWLFLSRLFHDVIFQDVRPTRT